MNGNHRIHMIKKLRQETGIGLAEALKMITLAEDDYDKALDLIRSFRLDRPERTASSKRESLIFSYVHMDYIGVMIEVRCDSSALAKCEDFRAFCKNICVHIAALNPITVDQLLDQEYVKDTSMTIRNLVKEYGIKVKENVEVARFVRMEGGK